MVNKGVSRNTSLSGQVAKWRSGRNTVFGTHSKGFRWMSLVVLSGGICFVGLAAWGAPRFPARPVPLPDYGRVGAFSLTDQEARPISQRDLQGKVWIAAFFFTRCAGQCPLMSARMAQLQRTLGDAPSLQLVSFTLDPSYDTPERLRAYARHYQAERQRWQFVGGDESTLHALASDDFHLSVADGIPQAEPIIHSSRLVLVDAQGHIRGYYDALDSEAMGRLAADAQRLIHAR